MLNIVVLSVIRLNVLVLRQVLSVIMPNVVMMSVMGPLIQYRSKLECLSLSVTSSLVKYLRARGYEPALIGEFHMGSTWVG